MSGTRSSLSICGPCLGLARPSRSGVGIGVAARLLPSFGENAAGEIARQAIVFGTTVALVHPFFKFVEQSFLSRRSEPATLEAQFRPAGAP